MPACVHGKTDWNDRSRNYQVNGLMGWKATDMSAEDSKKTQFDDQDVPVPRIVPDQEAPEPISKEDSGKESASVVSSSMTGSEPTVILPKRGVIFSLVVVTGEGKKKEFVLKEGENIVGRETSRDIFINDLSVSRKHAAVVVASRVVTVKDLGSKNGTFIDNQKIAYEVQILSETEVTFGQVKTVLKKNESGGS